MAFARLALCWALTAAKRLTEDLNDQTLLAPNLQDQATSSMLESRTSSCDQEGANLRVVLQKLGVAEDDMQYTHYCKWNGVECDEEKKCVKGLHLPGRNLQGELPMELGKLKHLEKLRLGQNNLSGDLRALHPLVRLQYLDLSETNITGGLDALREMKELESLFLFQTPVHGKLEDLKHLRRLAWLIASKTQTSGSLKVLSELAAVKHVLLAETSITGQLTALRGLKHLTCLDLSATAVTGTLQDLLDLPELEQVTLRNTNIAGRLTPDWAGRLPGLSILDLAGSLVHFVPTEKEADQLYQRIWGGKEMLPSLTVLDVSGCPLNSPVDELLWPMAYSQRIVTILATRSGLTGTLPYMANYLLATSLQTLDAGGLLSLAQNDASSITFAEGAFRSAFRQGVKLDLRGIKLTAEEAGEALDMLPPLRAKVLANRDRLACANLQATVLDVTPEMFLADQLCHCVAGLASPNATNLCFRCFAPAKDRCDSTSSNERWKDRGCAEGYEGILCSICAETFRSRAGRCERCEAAGHVRAWLAGALLVTMASAGLYVMRRKGGDMSISSKTKALMSLLLGQGPVLLQFFQLWGVLVGLVPTVTDGRRGDSEPGPALEEGVSHWLQLTVAGVRDALSLECFLGRRAWRISAFASPTLPLLLLMLCLLVEIAHWHRAACWESKGLGVDWALKVLLFCFVGGAASCEKLLRCQDVDADGEPLHEHSFLAALPHLRCEDSDMEAAWALYVGYGSALAYGLIIPSFLVYLIAKQNLELAINRRCVCWWAKANAGKKVTVQAKMMKQSEDDTETAKEENAAVSDNLLAAAIAYAAVFFRGEVRIEQQLDSMTLEQTGSHDENDDFLEFDATNGFSTMFSTLYSKEHKTDIDIRRCQSITRMLAEHEMIERKAHDDRVLAGAKTILFKYAACDDVWVEASLKVVAVALVTTVSVKSALLTLFVTIGMAVLLGAQKPYKQRQVNDLQSGCFICLSVAALGFWHGKGQGPWRLLARSALAVPFLVAGMQMLRPDGPEALALRLHQEAKAKLKESKSVELSVKKVKFI